MKRFAILIITLLLFSACNHKGGESTPKRMLTEKEMVAIMADIQIIEADLSLQKANQQDITGLPQQYYDQLFEHYGITDSIFMENMRYYTHSPATLERIMDSVVQRLTKVQSTFSTQ